MQSLDFNLNSVTPVIYRIRVIRFSVFVFCIKTKLDLTWQCHRHRSHTILRHSKDEAQTEKQHLSPVCLSEKIRIYHECEGMIVKSISRITVWHHEACPVRTNGDPEGRIFLSYPHKNNGFFFLLTTVFIYLFNISFQKSLNMLRCIFK